MALGGKWRKKNKSLDSSSASECVPMSYDDLEGLTMNLGVISALILGVVIAICTTIEHGDIQLYEFNMLMLEDQDFRKYTYSVMNDQDGSFEWLVEIAPDKMLDLKAVAENPSANEKDIRILTQRLAQKFPMEVASTWSTMKGHWSGRIYELYMVGGAVVAVPFFGCMIFFVFLAVSDAREVPAVTQIWARYGVPLIVTGYIMVGAGVILACTLLVNVYWARHPDPRAMDAYWISSNCILIPSLIATTLLCILILVGGIRAKNRAMLSVSEKFYAVGPDLQLINKRKALSSRGVAEIIQRVHGGAFAEYASAIIAHDITGAILDDLTPDLLKDLGIQQLGRRVALWRLFRDLGSGVPEPELGAGVEATFHLQLPPHMLRTE